MTNQQPYRSSPRGVLETVFRHKRKIIVCPLLAVALGTSVLLFYPRTYRSETQIFLRVGRESVGIDPTADTGHMIALQASDRKDEIKSAIEVIKSRGVIAQVVDHLGADVVLGRGESAKRGFVAQVISAPLRLFAGLLRSVDPVSDREQAIIEVERHLYVGAERGSTLIEVEYDAKSPQLAQTVCRAIVDAYQQQHMRIHRSEESRPFFAEQQDRLRRQLDGAMEAVREAKNEMGLADVQQRRATLEAQFSAVELDRLTTQQQLAASQARAADLEQQLTRVPERLVASRKSVPNVGADLLRDQLYALQVKSMDLRARYHDTHPRVQAINEQLAEAEQVLAQQLGERTETTDDVNPIHRQLSLELKQEQSILAGLKARLAELDQQSKFVLSEQRTVNGYELKIDQLSREAVLARDSFFEYAKNMEEARIDKALENERISNVSVVQPATLSERPVSPSKLLVAIGTLLLATAGTATVVMGSEWLGDRIQSGDDVTRALDLPVLASIPGDGVHRYVLPVKANGKPNPEKVHD